MTQSSIFFLFKNHHNYGNELEIEIKNANPKNVMELHWATDKDLAHIVNDLERENARLKQRITKLNSAINPCPLFAKPFSIIQKVQEYLIQACKIDKIAHLLSWVRSFVVESIKARENIISEALRL